MSNDLRNYLKVRNQLQNGDLLQWHGDYPFSRIIRVGTGEEYNHTSQVVRLPYFQHRVFSIEALDDGLHLWPLSDLLSRYRGYCDWFPCVYPYTQDLAIDSTRWLLAHLGRPYDWHSCISNWRSMIGIAPNAANDKYLYCSEASFLSWRERYHDDLSGIPIGAGINHLKHIKISPVPGDPMTALGIWLNTPSERLIES